MGGVRGLLTAATHAISPHHQTDVMRSHWKIAEHIAKEGRDPKADRDKAKALKLSLQKTSFVIGDDEEYD